MMVTKDIIEVLDNALDNIEGDFTDADLLQALEVLKLYPFVCDKIKSVPQYTKLRDKFR